MDLNIKQEYDELLNMDDMDFYNNYKKLPIDEQNKRVFRNKVMHLNPKFVLEDTENQTLRFKNIHIMDLLMMHKRPTTEKLKLIKNSPYEHTKTDYRLIYKNQLSQLLNDKPDDEGYILNYPNVYKDEKIMGDDVKLQTIYDNALSNQIKRNKELIDECIEFYNNPINASKTYKNISPFDLYNQIKDNINPEELKEYNNKLRTIIKFDNKIKYNNDYFKLIKELKINNTQKKFKTDNQTDNSQTKTTPIHKQKQDYVIYLKESINNAIQNQLADPLKPVDRLLLANINKLKKMITDDEFKLFVDELFKDYELVDTHFNKDFYNIIKYRLNYNLTPTNDIKPFLYNRLKYKRKQATPSDVATINSSIRKIINKYADQQQNNNNSDEEKFNRDEFEDELKDQFNSIITLNKEDFKTLAKDIKHDLFNNNKKKYSNIFCNVIDTFLNNANYQISYPPWVLLLQNILQIKSPTGNIRDVVPILKKHGLIDNGDINKYNSYTFRFNDVDIQNYINAFEEIIKSSDPHVYEKIIILFYMLDLNYKKIFNQLKFKSQNLNKAKTFYLEDIKLLNKYNLADIPDIQYSNISKSKQLEIKDDTLTRTTLRKHLIQKTDEDFSGHYIEVINTSYDPKVHKLRKTIIPAKEYNPQFAATLIPDYGVFNTNIGVRLTPPTYQQYHVENQLIEKPNHNIK